MNRAALVAPLELARPRAPGASEKTLSDAEGEGFRQNGAAGARLAYARAGYHSFDNAFHADGVSMPMKDSISRLASSALELLEGEDGGPASSGESQDALALLKADHVTVKDLFEEVLEDESSHLSGKRPTIDRILQELELHAKIEETIFYPALQQKTKKDTEDRQQVLEAYEEHGSVKELIRKIKRTTGRDETLRAKVQVLSELVDHHVKEEEESMFPEAQRLLGEKKLRALGLEIEQAKQRARRRGARGAAKKSAKKSAARNGATRGEKKSERV